MQDPSITLLAALKTDWALSDALAKANIDFNTMVFDRKSPKDYQVVVKEDYSIDDVWELGYGTILVTAIYIIGIYVHILSTSSMGPGKAKEYLWDMRDEIKRIVKANETGLTNLWKVQLRGRAQPDPQLFRVPPLLKVEQQIKVMYSV